MGPVKNEHYISNNYIKQGWKILLGIFILLWSAPSSSLAQQDGISIGQTVEVTSGQGLRLRAEPSTDASVIITLPYKTQMEVVGGSRSNGGYTWWELNGELGRGWAVENFLKVVDGQVSSGSDEGGGDNGTGCGKPYPAIEYCSSADTSTHVLKVDLADPHVRVETIIARDARNVNTSALEIVSSMGDRYQEEGAVVIINADYFGVGHATEGFTVVNGERLDGIDKGDDDEGAVYRSSIAFSRPVLDGGISPIRTSIQRFPEDRFTLDTDRMFNAIGGGPQIVFDGVWDWKRGRDVDEYSDYPECEPRADVINGECLLNTRDWDTSTKIWTVVGTTADGGLLMLVTPYEHVEAELTANNIQEAIKLDGGGSSQLWLDGVSVFPGDGRKVGSGLAVFYKHDYEIVESPSPFPVVVSGETLEITMTLRNKGADTWMQNEYAVSIVKSPWDMSLQSRLPQDVPSGETVTLTWLSPPVEKEWGFYNFDLQLVDQGREFPMMPISVRAIVIPKDLANEKEELEQMIRDMQEFDMEDIERTVTEFIQRQLMDFWERLIYDLTNCNLPTVIIMMTAVLFRHRFRWR